MTSCAKIPPRIAATGANSEVAFSTNGLYHCINKAIKIVRGVAKQITL